MSESPARIAEPMSVSARCTMRSSSEWETTSARSPGPPFGPSRISLSITTSPTRS